MQTILDYVDHPLVVFFAFVALCYWLVSLIMILRRGKSVTTSSKSVAVVEAKMSAVRTFMVYISFYALLALLIASDAEYISKRGIPHLSVVLIYVGQWLLADQMRATSKHDQIVRRFDNIRTICITAGVYVTVLTCLGIVLVGLDWMDHDVVHYIFLGTEFPLVVYIFLLMFEPAIHPNRMLMYVLLLMSVACNSISYNFMLHQDNSTHDAEASYNFYDTNIEMYNFILFCSFAALPQHFDFRRAGLYIAFYGDVAVHAKADEDASSSELQSLTTASMNGTAASTMSTSSASNTAADSLMSQFFPLTGMPRGSAM